MGFIINPSRFSTGTVELPSSICFDLSAADTASTGTANEWKNTVAAPADGASQTDYDFYLGTSGVSDSAEPTLTSSGSSAYYLCDGGDYFTAKQTTAAKIFNGAHKTSGTDSGPMWMVLAMRGPAAGLAADAFFGNTGGLAGDNAFRMVTNSGGNMRLWQSNGSTNQNAEIQAAGFFDDTEEPIILGWTWDSTSTGSEKLWANSSTGVSWSTAYSPQTSSTDATNPWTLAAGDESNPLTADSRVYSYLGGNSILTDSEMANIISIINSRHSIFSV